MADWINVTQVALFLYVSFKKLISPRLFLFNIQKYIHPMNMKLLTSQVDWNKYTRFLQELQSKRNDFAREYDELNEKNAIDRNSYQVYLIDISLLSYKVLFNISFPEV
jgi:hypothetical protein